MDVIELDALDAVTQLIVVLSRTANNRHCELEARLGRVVHDSGRTRFESGVDADFAARLLCQLETSKAWAEVTQWVHMVDRFYMLQSGFVRTTFQTQLPPAVSCTPVDVGGARKHDDDADSDDATDNNDDDDDDDVDDEDDDDDADEAAVAGSSSTMAWTRRLLDGEPCAADRLGPAARDCSFAETASMVTHVMKWDVDSVNLQWSPAHAAANNYDVRVSVKYETPVNEADLPQRVDDITAVRIKQRKSFRYASVGSDRAQWSIDITLVWQHHTYMEALAALKRGDPPKYEVEVECCEPSEYLRFLGDDKERFALTLLMKTADLFQWCTVRGDMPRLRQWK